MRVIGRRLFGADEIWAGGLQQLQSVESMLCVPGLRLDKGVARDVKRIVRTSLTVSGWATDVRVDARLRVTINATKERFALHIQLGNVARAFYDILKLESMYRAGRIDLASLAVPEARCAQVLGQNIANFERLSQELEVYAVAVSVPIALFCLGNDAEVAK